MTAKPKTTANSKSNSPLKIVWALVLVLFSNSFVGAYRYGVDSATIDFFTWWAVNHGLSHQYIQMPYADSEQKKLAEKIKNEIATRKTPNVEQRTFEDTLKYYNGRITATATPFYYVAFSRFFSDDYQQDKRRFVGFSVACFGLSVFILGRMLSYSYLPLIIFYSLMASWLSEYQIEVKVGNVNQIQLLLIAAFVYFFVKGKRFSHFLLAGLWLGFCILLKPNTCFILLCALLITLFNKQILKTAGLCAGFFLSCFLAFWEVAAYFRASFFDLWKSWLQTFPATISGTFSLDFGNYSLSKLILIHSGLDVSIFLYTAVGCLFVWKLFVSNRSTRDLLTKPSQAMKEEKVLKEAFYAVGFGLLIMFLGSKLVWSHYYLLMVVPLFLFFLRPQGETSQLSTTHSLTNTLIYVALGLSTTMVIKGLSSLACVVVYSLVALILLILLLMDD